MLTKNQKWFGKAVLKKCGRFVVFTAWGLWIAGTLRATDPMLPEAQMVLDRFIEATGGQKAYEDVQNQLSQGTVEFVNAGIKGNLKICRSKPSLLYVEFVIDGIGCIKSGVDGVIAWENSPMTGPRILESQELKDALREAAPDKYLDWKKYYPKAQVTGLDTVEGRGCFRVELTPEGGDPQQLYFDQTTGLLIKFTTTVNKPVGRIPIQTFIGDYRSVDGLRIPFKTRVVAIGQERILTLESVANNTEIPPDQFDPPAEIRMLMEKSRNPQTPSKSR